MITATALAADPLGLARSKNRELDPVGCEHLQRLRVHGGFGKPHSFRLPFETTFKIFDAPFDLSFLIAAIGQRKDHVVVALGDGGAVSGEMLLAFLVGFQNGGVDAWS